MPELQTQAIWFIYIAWVAWAATWMAMSRGAKAVVRRESRISRALHIAPMVLAAVLLGAGDYAGHLLAGPLLRRAGWMVVAGAVLVAAGLGFAVWARLVIGTNWSGTVTVKRAHVLIRTGPYALARHPIYTGLLTAFLGTAIAMDAWRGVLALALATLAFLRKMRTEEAFMVETFGYAYVAYRARTAALVPFLW
jgi:protein-S-isoprenylcysteine O-methyltransferase Ste14